MSIEGMPEVRPTTVPPKEEQEGFSEVSLRRVSIADFPLLKEYWMKMVAAHPEEYDLTEDEIAKMTEESYQSVLADPLQIRFFGVNPEGEVLGTIGLEIDETTLSTKEGRRGEIKVVAVDPEKVGKKIGGRMLQQLIEYAKQAGLSELTLFVRRENFLAKNLYAKYGFIATGTIANEAGNSGKVMEEYLLQI